MKLEVIDKLIPDEGPKSPSLRDYDGKNVDIINASVEKTGGKTRKGEEIEKPYVYVKNGTEGPQKLLASVAVVDLIQRRFKALDDYVAAAKAMPQPKQSEALKAAELPAPLPDSTDAWRFFTVKVQKQERGVKIS